MESPVVGSDSPSPFGPRGADAGDFLDSFVAWCRGNPDNTISALLTVTQGDSAGTKDGEVTLVWGDMLLTADQRGLIARLDKNVVSQGRVAPPPQGTLVSSERFSGALLSPEPFGDVALLRTPQGVSIQMPDLMPSQLHYSSAVNASLPGSGVLFGTLSDGTIVTVTLKKATPAA